MKRSLLLIGGAGLALLALLWITVHKRPPVSQASALPRLVDDPGGPTGGALADQAPKALAVQALSELGAAREEPTPMARVAAAPSPSAVQPIELTVVSARSAQPIFGAEVNFAGAKFWKRTSALADSNGRVELPGRLPVKFRVEHEGYLPLQHEVVEAPKGGQARVELLPFISLYGRIVGPADKTGRAARGRVTLMTDSASLGRTTELQVVTVEQPVRFQTGAAITEDGNWSIEFLPVPDAASLPLT